MSFLVRLLMKNPDNVSISESWVNENKVGDIKKEYNIDNYKFLIYWRVNKIGGGIIVYFKANQGPLEIENNSKTQPTV